MAGHGRNNFRRTLRPGRTADGSSGRLVPGRFLKACSGLGATADIQASAKLAAGTNDAARASRRMRGARGALGPTNDFQSGTCVPIPRRVGTRKCRNRTQHLPPRCPVHPARRPGRRALRPGYQTGSTIGDGRSPKADSETTKSRSPLAGGPALGEATPRSVAAACASSRQGNRDILDLHLLLGHNHSRSLINVRKPSTSGQRGPAAVETAPGAAARTSSAHAKRHGRRDRSLGGRP